MHLRTEPRFTTETYVLLQRLPPDAPQIPARILDVSRAGFRIWVQEAIPVGETLRVIIGEDLRILVTVRYAVAVANGHSVGVKRIDEWLADAKAGTTEGQGTEPGSGRLQARAHFGLLSTTALHDLSTKRASKGRKRPFLAGPPSTW